MKVKWMVGSLMSVAIFGLISCGGDGAGGAGNGAAGGNCARNYTTADLVGCYQGNSAMRWYCYDGAGEYTEKFWTAISGCADVGGGTYEIHGCTMKACSQKEGCGEYPVGQNQEGNLVINGVVYTESDCH